MSIASRHGKLRLTADDDDTRVHRLEDLLTADVFGAYRYLPAQLGIARSIGEAVSASGISLKAWAGARGVAWDVLAHATLAFWPALDGKEPDLVVALGSELGKMDLLVLVEVKLHAEQHAINGESQLGFYGNAMLDGLFDEQPFETELPVLRPVVLVTKEAAPPTSALRRASGELGDHVTEGRTDAFWIGWSKVAELAIDSLSQRVADGAPRHELALLEDLVADLADRGFTSPRALVPFPLPALAPLPSTLDWVRPQKKPTPSGFGNVKNLTLEPIDIQLWRWRLS